MNKLNNFKILVVDDEIEYREVLQMILVDKGYYVETASCAEKALKIIKRQRFDLVLTDLIMDGMDGIELLDKIKEDYKETEVILITGYGSIENAVEAMKKGAFTYFIKSHDPEELIMEIEKVRKLNLLENDNNILRAKYENIKFMLETKNKEFKRVLDIARKAANSNCNILILGESGVGKEVLAQYIHKCSDRKHGHFIPVNCHVFSDGLLESELFGHEKGAFTGALKSRKGRFEAAHGGTLFLDEVGDIPLSTQTKLLRAIETKTIERLGSNRPIEVDFRLISATNKNLYNEISKNNFREDLFYRISTITIEIPPLRDRKEDLPMLIDFFISKSESDLKKKIIKVEDGVMSFLLSYDYPGNIRELKNIIERLVVLSEDGIIREMDLPRCQRRLKDDAIYDINVIRPLKEVKKELEALYIEKALIKCNYNISETARKLDISRRQLFNKINEYNLRK